MIKHFRIGIHKIGVLVALLGALSSCQTVGDKRSPTGGNIGPVAGHRNVLPGCLSDPQIDAIYSGRPPHCSPSGPNFPDAPKYQGIVKPITSPIILRYRPFQETSATIKERVVVGTRIIKESLKSGTYQGQPVADGILLTVTINEGLDQDDMTYKAVFQISSMGEFNGVKSVEVVVGDKILKEPANSEVRSLRESLEIYVRKGFPRFGNKGVVVGDTLYYNTFNLLDMQLSIKSVVRGLTVHNGRDALFTDYVGSFSTTTSNGLIKGYSLFDLATGVQSLAEGVTLIPIPVEGKIATATILGKEQINLPPMRFGSKLKTTPAQQIKRQVSPATKPTGTIRERLRKLKEIHDDGLINDKDYKKKKDALLNQL